MGWKRTETTTLFERACKKESCFRRFVAENKNVQSDPPEFGAPAWYHQLLVLELVMTWWKRRRASVTSRFCVLCQALAVVAFVDCVPPAPKTRQQHRSGTLPEFLEVVMLVVSDIFGDGFTSLLWKKDWCVYSPAVRVRSPAGAAVGGDCGQQGARAASGSEWSH